MQLLNIKLIDGKFAKKQQKKWRAGQEKETKRPNQNLKENEESRNTQSSTTNRLNVLSLGLSCYDSFETFESEVLKKFSSK